MRKIYHLLGFLFIFWFVISFPYFITGILEFYVDVPYFEEIESQCLPVDHVTEKGGIVYSTCYSSRFTEFWLEILIFLTSLFFSLLIYRYFFLNDSKHLRKIARKI